ncbi:hypothetical protein [Nocardioides solisilvae]|uniref:hypothetical protein n=1 Tax=Nocardioides solisilvae TaxID=1542435 RepID=UPI0013A53794|nr:hypothetical protein [Nocardioides solisilvae]
MPVIRPTLAAASMLLAPFLLACGAEDPAGQPLAEPAGGESAAGSPAAGSTPDPTSGSTTDAPPGDPAESEDGTVAQASLTDEQAQLHADVLLFEEVAVAEAGEGFGGRFGSLTDGTADHFEVAAPRVAVADQFAIEWANGKVTTYTLSTDSGEQMTWEGGSVFLEVPVDQPEDADLTAGAEKLRAAIEEWIATYDEIPSVDSGFGDLTLAPGMFDEYDAEEVELELPDGLEPGGWSRVNDSYEVGLESEATDESAVVDQDGVRFFRTHRVV